MDPQEINNHNKPALTIPEQQHIGIEDTGPYVPTPQISEDLADAGLSEHIHKKGETYEEHLIKIQKVMDERYGTIRPVEEPSDESIQQVQNPSEHTPHEIPSTRTEISGQASSPQRSVIHTITSNVAKPFEIISTGIHSFLGRLFIRGSSASSAFNGRSTVADVTELQRIGNELPTTSIPENISSIHGKTPEETPESIPANVVNLRRDTLEEEMKNAA